jgi:hypothetical protein
VDAGSALGSAEHSRRKESISSFTVIIVNIENRKATLFEILLLEQVVADADFAQRHPGKEGLIIEITIIFW